MTIPNPHLALADAAEQRANAATPGPLEVNLLNGHPRTPDEMKEDLCKCIDLSVVSGKSVPGLFVVSTGPHDDALFVAITGNGPTSEDNAHFFAHARTDVPALAAAVRELDKVNTEQAAQLEKVMMERDEYKQAFNDELDGAHSLRLACGAKENETMVGFVRRLVEERDFAVREQAATTTALQAKLTEALNEAAKWRRIRNNSHGPCCQCQHCGRDYDECRCDLDGVADELEQAKAKLAVALALLAAGPSLRARCEQASDASEVLP